MEEVMMDWPENGAWSFPKGEKHCRLEICDNLQANGHACGEGYRTPQGHSDGDQKSQGTHGNHPGRDQSADSENR